MKCPKCGGPTIQLLTSFVCDVCDPVGGQPEPAKTSAIYTLRSFETTSRSNNVIPIAGLEPQTIVIPSHKTDPMPIGSTFILQQLNKGPFTIVPADDEVTVGTSGTSFTSGGLFALVQVIQLKQNTWWVSGCLK